MKHSCIRYLMDLFLLAVSDIDEAKTCHGLWTVLQKYDVPGFSVHFGACADNVYQALFSGLEMTLSLYVL